MRKLLVLSAVAILTAAATGCNCCDFSCFRRATAAAMPVCPPMAAPTATIVDPGCGQPAFGAPVIMPGPISVQ